MNTDKENKEKIDEVVEEEQLNDVQGGFLIRPLFPAPKQKTVAK